MAASLAPELDYQITEAIEHLGIAVEAGYTMDVAHDSKPRLNAVEVPERALKRSQDRQSSDFRSARSLLDIHVVPEQANDRGPRTDGAVSRDVRDVLVDRDAHVVPNRLWRLGQLQTESCQATHDHSHRGSIFRLLKQGSPARYAARAPQPSRISGFGSRPIMSIGI